MSSNKAVGYDFDGEAPLVDWDWAAPAIQAYSTANDLYKVWKSYGSFLTFHANVWTPGKVFSLWLGIPRPKIVVLC